MFCALIIGGTTQHEPNITTISYMYQLDSEILNIGNLEKNHDFFSNLLIKMYSPDVCSIRSKIDTLIPFGKVVV